MAAGEPYGVVPAGLGARDTLRTEMGYPLHGQDISPRSRRSRRGSAGRSGGRSRRSGATTALRAEKEAGPARVLRGLVAIGRGIPRPHMQVQRLPVARWSARSPRGRSHRRARSGWRSRCSRAGIEEGDEVVVDVRGRSETFAVTKPPFVTPGVSA